MFHLLPVALLATNVAAGSIDEELLARVRTAHAAAVAALVPIEFTYEFRHLVREETVTGEHVEDHQVYRTWERRPSGLIETRMAEGRCINIFHANGTANVTSSLPSFGNGKLQLLLHLFRFTRPGSHDCTTLDVILAGPHQLHVCTWDKLEGRKMVRLAFTVGQLHHTLWLDPSVNFLVRRKVTQNIHAEARGFYNEVTQFKDLGDGVYMPMEAHILRQGQTKPEAIIRVNQVRVGQPIAAEKLQLTVPVGYRVWDRLADKGFVVAPDGTWQEDRMPPAPTSSKAIATRPLPPPAERPQPTAAEPEGWTTWLVSGSVGLVVAGLVLLAWRKLRGEG